MAFEDRFISPVGAVLQRELAVRRGQPSTEVAGSLPPTALK